MTLNDLILNQKYIFQTTTGLTVQGKLDSFDNEVITVNIENAGQVILWKKDIYRWKDN